MDLIQLIGFLISVLAVFVLVTKKIRDERHRKQHPEEFAREEEEKEERLRAFLKSLDVEMEEQKNYSPPPPPREKPPVPRVIKRIKSEVEERLDMIKPLPHQKTQHTMHYPGALIEPPGRGKYLIERLPSKKLLMLIPEIISKPKWRE